MVLIDSDVVDLHNTLLRFIHCDCVCNHVVDSGLREIYSFSDDMYGSFVIEYIPYTLGGYKKDLIIVRYHEFNTIYMYYDVIKRCIIIEKNNRVLHNMDVIEDDVKYIYNKIYSIKNSINS